MSETDRLQTSTREHLEALMAATLDMDLPDLDPDDPVHAYTLAALRCAGDVQPLRDALAEAVARGDFHAARAVQQQEASENRGRRNGAAIRLIQAARPANLGEANKLLHDVLLTLQSSGDEIREAA